MPVMTMVAVTFTMITTPTTTMVLPLPPVVVITTRVTAPGIEAAGPRP